jgi:hypothetical protein
MTRSDGVTDVEEKPLLHPQYREGTCGSSVGSKVYARGRGPLRQLTICSSHSEPYWQGRMSVCMYPLRDGRSHYHGSREAFTAARGIGGALYG